MKLLFHLKLTFFIGLFFVSTFATAQRKEITGTVTDEEGVPLIGVNILIEGKNRGTQTNFDGEYSINANPRDVLIYSFVGYNTESREIGDQNIINVQMNVGEDLEEVVVVGYGTTKKSDFTGAVSSIKPEKILETKSPNFMEGLQGRMAGVQITPGSGAPGSDINIRIRGATSINAGSKPLYVIDGVQFDPNDQVVARSGVVGDDSQSPLSFINPEDIKSIEVLKDASATAIYGARGANGVVIITTKGGKKGGHLSLNSYISAASIPENRKIDVLTATDYADWYRYFSSPGADDYFWESTDPDAAPVDFTNAPSVNWQDELMDTAITQNYSLNFSTAGNTSDLAGSLSYANQNGAIKNSDFKRLTGRLKGSTKISKKTELGGLLLFSNAISNGIAEGGGQGPQAGAIKSIVLFNPLDPSTYNGDTIDEADDTGEGPLSNPLNYILLSERNLKNTNLLGNMYINYDISKALNFRSTFGGKFSDSKLKEFYPQSVIQGGGFGKGEIKDVQSTFWYQENVLTLNKKFNPNHRINATMVFETRNNKREIFGARNNQFEYEENGADDLGAGSLPSPPYSNSVTVTNYGALARANYFLKNDTYIFTGSIRADGSSKFSKGNQWGYFPSAAFAWKISNENFLEPVEAISNLKLRTSYGVTGNDRLSPFQYSPFYSSTLTVSDDELVIAYKPAVLGNNDLTWETSTQYDLGMDLGLFKNKFTLTADYYKRVTEDMLFRAIVPSTTGFQNQWQNIGRIDNEGYELAVGGYLFSSNKFTWKSDFNISFQKSTIKSLGGVDHMDILMNVPGEHLVGRLQVGQPFGAFYGYEFGGIYQYEDFEEFQGLSNEEAAELYDPSRTYTLVTDDQGNPIHPGHSSQSGQKPGDMYFVDQNGDNSIDGVNDKKILGSSIPEAYGGFSNSIKLGNFDLNMNFTFSIGNEIYNESKFYLHGAKDRALNVSKDYFDNAWQPLAQSESIVGYKGFGKILNSSYFLEDGSYLKFQALSLGYSFPLKITNNFKVKKVRLYASANNIYTWTDYTGFDPDFNGPNQLPGYDILGYPNPLTVTGGLEINF